MKTVLCICTFRRPAGLRKLLDTLPSIDATQELEVVVADNDPAGAGLAVCAEMSAQGYPFTLHTVAAGENSGISAARNAACLQALALKPDLVAFLDDDEWPEPQWLAELLRVQQHCNADLVGGPTRPVFPHGTELAITVNPYYGADMALPDETQCQLQAGGNFLMKADVLQMLAPEFFNPAFAHSGGEDLAFFTQLHLRGHSMFWAANAIVHEPVPAARLQPGWIRQRVVNIHNSRVRVMQMLQPGLLPGLIRGLKTAVLGVVALASSCLAWMGPDWAERARQLRWKFEGKMSAHRGHATVRNETY